MKIISAFPVAFVLLATSLQSQNTPPENSGTLLIRIKSSNSALLERQAATLTLLKTMEADAQQLRIVAKRG